MPQKSNKNQKTQKHEGQGWLSFFLFKQLSNCKCKNLIIIYKNANL